MIQALVLGTVGRIIQLVLGHLPLWAQLALMPVQIAVLLAAAALLYRVVELPARLWLRARIERAAGPAESLPERRQVAA
jgi:peptidoglycan/LPS O-acetylase OafA/YrhL